MVICWLLRRRGQGEHPHRECLFRDDFMFRCCCWVSWRSTRCLKGALGGLSPAGPRGAATCPSYVCVFECEWYARLRTSLAATGLSVLALAGPGADVPSPVTLISSDLAWNPTWWPVYPCTPSRVCSDSDSGSDSVRVRSHTGTFCFHGWVSTQET